MKQNDVIFWIAMGLAVLWIVTWMISPESKESLIIANLWLAVAWTRIKTKS